MNSTVKNGNDGAIHAIGNGEFLVYGKGPDIINMYGPDYSSPSFGTITLEDASQALTSRKSGTNTWTHSFYSAKEKNVFVDAIDPEYNVFEREITASFSCTLRFHRPQSVRTLHRQGYAVAGQRVDCLMHILPEGTPFFTKGNLSDEHRLIFLASGCVRLNADGETIDISPGEGKLTIVAAKTPDIDRQLAYAVGQPDIPARDEAFFRAFLAHGAGVREGVPSDHPEAERVRAALESTAVQIRAQQSSSGGVMAGHFYPMAYVRDQAGTLRGLLRMGYRAQARKILEFWHAKWLRHGNLYNAESMGNEDCRLMFSNDEVEVPAYVVFCALEYLDATGETDFTVSIFDMLEWALLVQLKHLKHGMTGFSGDETYIAGFIFPRSFLYHGSAESTLLFIESAKRALAFAEENNLLDAATHARIAGSVAEAERLYRDNFVIDGILYGNNPAREQLDEPPHFHFGYCQADELTGGPARLTWLERGADGIYRCPDCIDKAVQRDFPADRRFLLGSVNLLPPYYHTTLFTREDLQKNAQPYMDAFDRTGVITSDINGGRSLGYDFGLFLYNMAFLGTGLEDRALSFMLDMLDKSGMWSEYYIDGAPDNCRCRPWESAINMEAIVYAMEQYAAMRK